MKEARINSLTIQLGPAVIFLVAFIGFWLIAVGPVESQAGETQPVSGATSEQPGGQRASGAPTTGSSEAERTIILVCGFPVAEEYSIDPISTLNRDLMDKSGERQTAELLRDLPFANANGVSVSNNANGFTPGAASVSLRGFTPEATLVLIDGRRVAPYPLGAGGAKAFQDLFSIQLSAVQSIEILKDGGFINYGANAVAGAVNFKFWKDYRGTQVTLNYANTLDKDAAIYQGDVLFGIGDDTVTITGDVFFYHHNALFNRDRGNSAIALSRSNNSSPFNLQLADAVVTAAGGTPANPQSSLTFAQAPFLSNGLAPANSYVYSAERSALFNSNAFSGSYPEQERYGGYVSFSDKLCEDQLQIYGDVYYAKVKTRNELEPGATGSFFAPGNVILAIPPHAPLNGVAPPNTPQFIGQGGAFAAGENPTNVDANAFNPFNPFNQIISGGTRARLAEFGNRVFDNTTNAWLATLGVKGDKLFDGNWGYDAGLRYSEIENDSSKTQVSASRFNRILNAADPIFDPNSDQFIGTTTPYNPFGDYRVPIPSNAPSVNFATVHPKDIDISKLTTLDLNIYTTELFKLPAGGIGLAFGGQFRRESIEQDPDRLELDNDIIEGITPAITHAGRKDYAFYGDTIIPLFSPELGIIGLHSLEVSAGFRFEEFLNNNSNALVPKVGVRWQPIDEQLLIRSTWGEGLSEPSLFELYASPASGRVPFRFNGVIEEGATVVTASNPKLKLEDSRTWTGGAVYSPKWMPWGELTLSIDLWDIERSGVAAALSPQELVRDFLRSRVLLPGENVQFDPATGQVNFVRTAFQSTGRQNARGADLSALYQLVTQRYGAVFTVLSDWAYLDQFIFQPTAGSTGRNTVAQVSDSFAGDGWYRWRGTTRIDCSWDNFDLNATWRYIGGFREIIKNDLTNGAFENLTHEHWIHPTNFIDSQASYSLVFTPATESTPVAGYSKTVKEARASKEGKPVESTAAYSMPCWKTLINNSTITIGCNNIFGQDPPKAFGFFLANPVRYPGFDYDNIGRFWYVEVTKKF